MRLFGFAIVFGCMLLMLHNCGARDFELSEHCRAKRVALVKKYTIAPGMAMPHMHTHSAANVLAVSPTLPLLCLRVLTPLLYSWKIEGRYKLPNPHRASFRLGDLAQPSGRLPKRGGLFVYDPANTTMAKGYELDKGAPAARPLSTQQEPLPIKHHKLSPTKRFRLPPYLAKAKGPLVVLHLLRAQTIRLTDIPNEHASFSTSPVHKHGSIPSQHPLFPCLELKDTLSLEPQKIYQLRDVWRLKKRGSFLQDIFLRPLPKERLRKLKKPNLRLHLVRLSGLCTGFGALVTRPQGTRLHHWYRWRLEKKSTIPTKGGPRKAWVPALSTGGENLHKVGYPPVIRSIRDFHESTAKPRPPLRLRVEAIHPSGITSTPQLLAIDPTMAVSEARVNRHGHVFKRGMSFLYRDMYGFFIFFQLVILLWGAVYWLRRRVEEKSID